MSIHKTVVLLALALSLVVPILGPDDAAAAEARSVCDLCGEAIRGQYARYEDLGWDVCSACLASPRCTGCGLPRTGHLVDGPYFEGTDTRKVIDKTLLNR